MMQKGTEMPKVILYSYHLSSCSWRVRLALMLKGMFEKKYVCGFSVSNFISDKFQHSTLVGINIFLG